MQHIHNPRYKKRYWHYVMVPDDGYSGIEVHAIGVPVVSTNECGVLKIFAGNDVCSIYVEDVISISYRELDSDIISKALLKIGTEVVVDIVVKKFRWNRITESG